MKKALVMSLGLLIAVSALTALSGKEGSRMVLKPGDEVFACQCGEACPCGMMSRKAGKCGCGKELAKVKVKSVGADTAVLVFPDGREQTFKTVGKYMCGCTGCDCNSISQTPAKCSCDVDMVEVK